VSLQYLVKLLVSEHYGQFKTSTVNAFKSWLEYAMINLLKKFLKSLLVKNVS